MDITDPGKVPKRAFKHTRELETSPYEKECPPPPPPNPNPWNQKPFDGSRTHKRRWYSTQHGTVHLWNLLPPDVMMATSTEGFTGGL